GYSYDGFFKTTEEAQAWASIVNQDQINRRRVQAPTAEPRMLQAGDIKIKDLNGDGVINTGANTLDDPGERRIIGDSLPRYPYGLRSGGDWTGIHVHVVLHGHRRRHWCADRGRHALCPVDARPYDSFRPVACASQVWSPANP